MGISPVSLLAFSLLISLLFDIAIAHGDSVGLGMLGGRKAMNAFRGRSMATFEVPVPVVRRELQHLHEIEDSVVEYENLGERAIGPGLNQRCGYVNGTCPPGFCCSIGGYW